MADLLPGQRVVAVSLSGETAGQLTPAFYTPLHRVVAKITAQIATLTDVVNAISDANGNLIASTDLQINTAELSAITAIQGAGFTVRDPLGNWYGRTFADTSTIAWTNGGGIVGNPSADVPNDAITYTKLQNISATSRVLGRKTADAGDAEECSLSDVLDFIGSAATGDILYRGASAWMRLPKGTDGQVLTLATGLPAWAAASGGGASRTIVSISTDTTAGTTGDYVYMISSGAQLMLPTAVGNTNRYEVKNVGAVAASVAGNSSSALGAHVYWRINASSAQSGVYCTIGEIEMRATVGGANQCTGGTATSDSSYASPTYDPDKAFDNNANTNWTSATVFPHWIRYQFASAVSVAQFAIQAASAAYGTANESPQDFTLEYSDNGTSWTTAATITAQTGWTLSEQRLFTVTGGGGETIDDNASPTILSPNAALALYSDGANWKIF